MIGRKPKPAPAETNIVSADFGATRVDIAEPDWLAKFPGDEWGRKQAEIAAAKWKEVKLHMEQRQTLGPENASAIEILSVAFARWKLAETHIAENGPIVKAPRTGVPMQNPYLSVANNSALLVLKIEGELGLPPTTRARVGKLAPPKQSKRAADEFL